MNKYSDYQYLLAYLVFGVIIMLFIRTRFGYVTTYYLLALYAFVLLLVHSKFLIDALQPLNG